MIISRYSINRRDFAWKFDSYGQCYNKHIRNLKCLNRSLERKSNVGYFKTSSSKLGWFWTLEFCSEQDTLAPDLFYPKPAPCCKMAFTACRNTTGDIEEVPCRPMQNDPNWDTYIGLAYQLQASNTYQICDGLAFYIACSTLPNISLHFCNYLLTLKDRPDSEYDSM